MKTAAKSIEDVALFIPHQSNSRMITSVARNVGLDDHSKISSNIESVGNTSAASIPIALHECVLADRVQPGDLLLLTAVGSGMMYGSILLEW